METVITCTKAKEWTNQKGEKVPIYSVGLSDGRGGQSFGKEIPVGTPVSELEITDKGNFGLDFKLKKAAGFGGFGGKRAGNESFSLAYAKDILVASWNGTKSPKALTKSEMFGLADEMYAWLERKKQPEAKAEPSATNSGDGLPWS